MIFLDPKPGGPARRLLDSGQAYFQSRGYTKAVEPVGEVELTVMAPRRKPKSGNPAEQPAPAYFVTKTAVGVASSRAAGKWLIDAYYADKFASLAGVSDYRAAVEAATAGKKFFGVRWWLRPLPLWSAVRGKAPAPRHRDWLAIMRAGRAARRFARPAASSSSPRTARATWRSAGVGWRPAR